MNVPARRASEWFWTLFSDSLARRAGIRIDMVSKSHSRENNVSLRLESGRLFPPATEFTEVFTRMFASAAHILGTVICLLVALQALVFLCRSLLQLFADSRINNLRIQQLNDEVHSLRNQHRIKEESTDGWTGFRKFRVDRKVTEADNTHSIYLVPHDGKTMPSFKPGQHLTFQLRLPGVDKPVTRCYSLSDGPGRPYYRCTIKKVAPPPDRPDLPPGKASSYMNDVVQQGDILDVKSPKGSFFLDEESDKPVVLLAGGIGITPMASMLHSICNSGSDRSVVLFYGVNHGNDHPMKNELAALCGTHDNVQQVVCYSAPLPTDKVGRDYHVAGWVTPDLLKNVLRSPNHEFYLCGPPPFMDSLGNGLREWGVPDDSIHTEAFGPASLKKTRPPNTQPVSPDAAQPMVGFDRSQKVAKWNPEFDSILEFAEAQGIEVESGCRAGNCGSCAIAIKSGNVKYADNDHAECEKGTCLPCICVPDGGLVLDA